VCGSRHIRVCAVGPSKETGLCSGCVEGDVCAVGLSKETGPCIGCIEGVRSLQWVCVRRQVCAVGVLKEIGLCSRSV